MRVLALDTTTREGSVALVVDDRIIDERRGDPASTHAARLPADILALLVRQRMTVADVDLFAVASGPGSFTGLRVGIATMQGLSFVRRRPMVGVSALDALAQLGSCEAEPGGRVAAWIDAHRGDVFAALYEATAAPLFSPGRIRAIDGPTVAPPDATLERWTRLGEKPDLLTGDGATLYAGAVVRSAPGARIVPAPPLAGAIGRLASARAEGGDTVDPAAIQAVYVRRPDAELAREAAAARPRWRIEQITSPDQIDAVLEIERASFTNPWTREMYLSELGHRGLSYCFVAKDRSDRIAGFCSFWRVLDELHINNLAVSPERRREGVASALLTHVLGQGRKLGAARATLEVRRSNDAARHLYERFGFSIAGVRQGYYTHPAEDALVLWREGLNDGG